MSRRRTHTHARLVFFSYQIAPDYKKMPFASEKFLSFGAKNSAGILTLCFVINQRSGTRLKIQTSKLCSVERDIWITTWTFIKSRHSQFEIKLGRLWDKTHGSCEPGEESLRKNSIKIYSLASSQIARNVSVFFQFLMFFLPRRSGKYKTQTVKRANVSRYHHKYPHGVENA